MTSDDISSSFLALTGACDVTGAWRRSQKLGRSVEARVSSVEARNFRFYRSVDKEAVTVARVPRRRSKSDESEAVRGNFPKLVLARRGA